MEENLKTLISEGQKFNFKNNCHIAQYGTYSRATDELLAWISSVEDFLLVYYGEDSSPYKLFITLDRTKLSGNSQSSFEKQLTKVRGALKACEKIKPKPVKKRFEENQILSLLKNPYFYIVLVVLIGGSFTLGLKIGESKFDKEKIDLYNENKELVIILNKQNQDLMQKDTTIHFLQKSVYNLTEKLSETNELNGFVANTN